MRQAGRYMPEYRALRQKYSFESLCHNPELIREVTLLPVRSLSVDAAILFADILHICEVFNRPFSFVEGVGPVISEPIREMKQPLPERPVEECLGFVKKGIELLQEELSLPLIGFSGGPFTVASYLVEGGSSRDLKATKQWMFRDPEGFHRLLDQLTQRTLDYLKMQVQAGVQAVQIFDSWAGLLGYAQFRDFVLPYLKCLVEGLRETGIPVILFCRGSSYFAHELASLHPACVGLDWHCDLTEMRRKIPRIIALQGNFDPYLLYAPTKVIREEVTKTLEAMSGEEGYIVNLGHGISPDMSVEAVKAFVDAVQESRALASL